jgi:hypothetical protein
MKLKTILLFLWFGVAFVAERSFADIDLLNQTHSPVTNVFGSPTKKNQWVALNTPTFAPGEHKVIEFPEGTQDPWDLKFDCQGKTWLFEDLDTEDDYSDTLTLLNGTLHTTFASGKPVSN